MAKSRPIAIPSNSTSQKVYVSRLGLVVSDTYIYILGVRAIRHYGLQHHLVMLDPFYLGEKAQILIPQKLCSEWGQEFENLRTLDLEKNKLDDIYEIRISPTTAVMCWLSGIFNGGHFAKASECLYTPEPGATLIRSFKIKYGVASRIVHILPDDQLIYHMATYDIDGKIIE